MYVYILATRARYCTPAAALALRYMYVYVCDSGQLVITGHEERLIIGLPRDIQCLWTGDSNATLMEWFVVGLEAVAVESATDTRELVLTLDPDTDGLDGAMFTCRATLSHGRQVEKSITLVVRGMYVGLYMYFITKTIDNINTSYNIFSLTV